MKRQLNILAVFLAAFSVLQPVPARAEIISIDVIATVDEVIDDGLLSGEVGLGDTVHGTFVYDSTLTDNTDDPSSGDYFTNNSLNNSINLSVNGLRFNTDLGADFLINIINDAIPDPYHDSDSNFDQFSYFAYSVYFYINDVPTEGHLTTIFGWKLIGPTTALSSDALPTTAPVVADWPENQIWAQGYNLDTQTSFSFSAHVTCAALSGSGDCGGGFSDADSDGVEDAIDTGPGSFADTNTPPTTGSIVDAGGLAVSVADAADPAQGVEITVGPGPGAGQASFSVCGFPVLLSPGSSTVITCGSIELIVNEGSAQILLDNDTVAVDIGAGGIAKITQNTDGTYTIENLGDNSAVTVTRNDAPVTINPGSSYVVGQLMTGYFSPVDMNGIFNVAKAGSAVPLKWLLTYVPEGTPVTDLASVTLRVQNVGCTSGSLTDQLEEVASDGSGLKNLGDGYYQLNWKTLKSYSGTCKSLVLDFGGGNTAPPALFSFK